MEEITGYLESKGYEVLGFDGGLVHYRDNNGKVLGSSEGSIMRIIKEESAQQRAVDGNGPIQK